MPCCLMHWAAACSSAARPAHEPWADVPWPLDAPWLAGWLPWPAAWLRLGTAAAPEPELAHPATSSAPASAARTYLLFFIWTSRVDPRWAGRDQLYAAADDRGATGNRALASAAGRLRRVLAAVTCAATAGRRRLPAGRVMPVSPRQEHYGTVRVLVVEDQKVLADRI